MATSPLDCGRKRVMTSTMTMGPSSSSAFPGVEQSLPPLHQVNKSDMAKLIFLFLFFTTTDWVMGFLFEKKRRYQSFILTVHHTVYEKCMPQTLCREGWQTGVRPLSKHIGGCPRAPQALYPIPPQVCPFYRHLDSVGRRQLLVQFLIFL